MNWRLQRLPSANPTAALLASVAACAAALLLAAGIAAIAGFNPLALLGQVLSLVLGTRFGLEDFGLLLTPLILTGLSVIIMRRMGLWNIGAEGQFYAGAVGAAAIGLFIDGPPAVMLVVMFFGGAFSGALWIAIPALARAYAGVNELITTLLLNFVALLLVYYLGTGPWRDRGAGTLGSTPRIPYEMREFWGIVHWGLPIAVAMTFLVAGLLTFTRWGYEVRISGANPENAQYAGIPVRRRILSVMFAAGAISGIAGMLEIAGTVHRLQGGISNNFGYLGIIVAVLAGSSCLGVLATAGLFAFILSAGIVLQTQGLTTSAVVALTGLILLFNAIGQEFARYRVLRAKGGDT
ncbi:nucleoside ABC transporter membrane protein [Salinihabitans flavidus]|uniref:Nucleoside ABC transporter membrane protein n=1 Tax=Salinihabitans flavidus TaxID=569882 RepID=A0A1H8W4V3_9RHOB|nr:ABC transporter permease [Salinihabitans flavidus]SEP22573.1 nucleoside ABC transporter membrane protein [Salinihabitans flavidus]